MSKTTTAPAIAILGGGVGGTVLANLLTRELDEEEAHIYLERSKRPPYLPTWMAVSAI